jgi:hypothetical protein
MITFSCNIRRAEFGHLAYQNIRTNVKEYSETSLNWPALEPKNMAGLEWWPVSLAGTYKIG